MAEGQQSLGAASFQISLAGLREFLTGMAQARAATARMADGAEADLTRSAKAINSNITALERLVAAERAAGRDTTLYEGRLTGLRQQLEVIERLKSAAQTPVGAAVSLNSEQAIAGRIAKLREERSAVDMNSASYRQLGLQIRQLERQQGSGGGLQSLLGMVPGAAGVSAQLAIAGAGIAAIATATAEGVRRFAEYDGALRQLGALSGATGNQLDELNQAIGDTANKSGIGKVALAQLGSELARTGFSAQQITEALDGVVTVAQATGEDVQTAAGVVGQALKLWSIPAEKASDVGDMLAKSANLSATSLSSLGETFKYVGPAAASSGQSLEDIVTLTTLLAEGGIKGSMAGTGLTAVLTRLKTASAGLDSENSALVRGNAKRVEAFEQIGAAVRNTDGTMRSLMQVLPEIKARLDALTPQDRDLIANALFGEEGGRSFLALTNQSVEKMQRFNAEIRNSAGESKKLQTQTNGLSRELGRTGQALNGLLESFGNLVDALGAGVALQGLSLILKGLGASVNFVAEGLRVWVQLFSDLAVRGGRSLAGLFKGPEDADLERFNKATEALKRQREVQRQQIESAGYGTNLAKLDKSLASPMAQRAERLEQQAKIEAENNKRFLAVYERSRVDQQVILKDLDAKARQQGTNVEALLKKELADPKLAERARALLDLYRQIREEAAKADPRDESVQEWNRYVRAMERARHEMGLQSKESSASIARVLGFRQDELRVVQQLAEQEGSAGEKAKARAAELEAEVKALQAQLQVRQEILQVEGRIQDAAAQRSTQTLDSYSRLTDAYREQVRLGAQIASEQGGIRTDALNARLQELERQGLGSSGAALALKREIFGEELAIARTRQEADQQALQYEALKLGYAQQRARIEAEIAVNQARIGLVQAEQDRTASGAVAGTPEAMREDRKVDLARALLGLAEQRLQLLGREQAAERQNLTLQQQLLGVQQERADADLARRAKALGVSTEPDPGLSLRPGESTGVLLRPDPSLNRELSSAYEGATSRLAELLAGTLGRGADAQTELLAQIASRETVITVNVDSSGGVNTVAGMG